MKTSNEILEVQNQSTKLLFENNFVGNQGKRIWKSFIWIFKIQTYILNPGKHFTSLKNILNYITSLKNENPDFTHVYENELAIYLRIIYLI